MASSTSTSRPAARDMGRVARLDGIRGICALAVLTVHVAYSTIVLSRQMGPPKAGIFSILVVGMTMLITPFFILSGYMLYKPWARMTILGTEKPRLFQFVVRRTARLLPAYYLVVIACLALLNYSLIGGIWDVLRPFALANIYDPHNYIGLDVAWTVPAEAQFYVALPILAWIMHRLGRSGANPAAKARRMLAPLPIFLVVQFVWGQYVHSHYHTWVPQFYYPLSVCGAWAVGMAMAVWAAQAESGQEPAVWRAARTRPNLFWLGAAVVYLISCAELFSKPGTADFAGPHAQLAVDATVTAFSFLSMMPLIIPGAASRLQRVVLENRPMVFLGRISYGIYLWHFFWIYVRFGSGSVFGKIVPVQLWLGKYGFWELEIPTVVGSIASAALAYYLLEQPILNLTNRALKRKTVPAPVGPAIPVAVEQRPKATVD